MEGLEIAGDRKRVRRRGSTRLELLVFRVTQLQEELGGEQVEVIDAAAAEKDASSSGPRKVDPSQRVTTRYMTKYEKARILGTRALQLR